MSDTTSEKDYKPTQSEIEDDYKPTTPNKRKSQSNVPGSSSSPSKKVKTETGCASYDGGKRTGAWSKEEDKALFGSE